MWYQTRCPKHLPPRTFFASVRDMSGYMWTMAASDEIIA